MKALKKVTSYFNNFTLAGVVWAEEINLKPSGQSFGNLGNITIPAIVSALIKLILVVTALIAFVFLIIGGIKWIVSGGDKEATAGAQKTITAALIGLLIVFAAWAIMHLIEVFFSVHIFNLTIPVI